MKIKKGYMSDEDVVLIESAKTSETYFIDLLVKYRPICLKLWKEYYVSDMTFDDWQQESAIVLLKVIDSYDVSKNVSFGIFYKRALTNRLYDILRKKRAKRRTPESKIVSWSQFSEYYDATFSDDKAVNAERASEIYEILEEIISKCNDRNREVLIDAFTFAKTKDMHYEQIKGILRRCQLKFEEADV